MNDIHSRHRYVSAMNEIAPWADAGSRDFKARFTAAEFVRMGDAGVFDDIRLELIDGELERMPPPKGSHASRQTAMIAALWMIVRERVMVEMGIDLGGDTLVGADIVIVRVPIAEHRFALPDEIELAIEIAETTLSRDLGLKRERYARAGVAEYWVVDNERSVTHVFRKLAKGDYADLSTVPFDRPLAVPGTDATITIA